VFAGRANRAHLEQRQGRDEREQCAAERDLPDRHAARRELLGDRILDREQSIANTMQTMPRTTAFERALPSVTVTSSARAGRDDHEGLRQRIFVGQRQIDLRGQAGRGDRFQPLGRAAGQKQRRLAARQIDHAQIAEEHAGAESGAERLGARLLGREALA